MNKEMRCENCKHYYSYFKQITNEDGLPDFIIVPSCRLDNELKLDGTPVSPDCFEPK